MLVYFTLFIIVILINLVPSYNRKFDNAKLAFSFVLIFIFLAIRKNFGGDYNSYLQTFYFIKDYFKPFNFENISTEAGFVILNYILPSHRSLIVVTSAFTCYTYYWAIKSYVPVKYYGFVLLLMLLFSSQMFFFQLSGLRNSIALNIMILATPLIIKRRFWSYISLTVLAFLFHKSAILYMPVVYFLATPKDIKKNDIYKWGLVTLLFLVMSSTVLVNILRPLIDTYFNKYSGYLDHATEYQFSELSSIFIFGFVGVFMALSFLLIKNTNLTPTENVIFKLSLLYILSFALNTLSPRGAQYFITFFILNIVFVINKVKKPILTVAYIIAILIYAFYLINSFMGERYILYETYHTIFN